MMDFLRLIEQSSFSQWVVGSSSVFAFPTILLLHTIGMGVVVGICAGVDLRILGFAPALPLAPMERFYPLMWVAADATTKMINPDFYVKMVFILLAVINARMVRNRVLRDPLVDKGPLSSQAKILAVTSLILWLGAITAGRLLAYVGPVSGISN
jgi:hypothetical protein